MFTQNVNYYNIAAISVILGLSIILFGLYIGSAVTRLYTITFIPIDAAMGLFIYYELTRKKYNNEDVISFDPYFRDLSKVERSKSTLLNKINKVETDFKNLSSELMLSFDEFNSILPNKDKEEEFKKYINRCVKEFEKNREELVNYNKTVIDQFNESLNEYLTLGLSSDYEIPEFRTIDIDEMLEYITTMRKMFETYFSTYSKEKLQQGVLKTPEKIISIFTIAQKFNAKFTDSEMLNILQAVNDKVKNRDTISAYLLSLNLISEDVFYEAVVKRDWDWCVLEDYVFTRSNKKIIELYNEIVEYNAIRCCNKMLKMSTIDQTNILTRVLNTATKSNACTQVIKFRIIIQTNDQEFNKTSTMYENMAVSIRNYVYANPGDENRAWIINVCNNNAFYENKDQIVDIYTRISTKIKSKYEYVNKILICFYEGDLSKNNYVDTSKLTSFYLENLLTLNNQFIKVFALLACSIILIEDKNQDNIDAAIEGIKKDPIGREAAKSFENPVDMGKFVLKDLLKNNLDKVIPIVNRVETKRMSLDKLKGMSK